MKIALHRSKIHGNGVAATAGIRKGEVIAEYKGRLITHRQADTWYASHDDSGHTFLFILNDRHVIDGNVNGNIARWINHGCDPNAEAVLHEDPDGDPRKDRVLIEAIRYIRKDEEITYDYQIEVEQRPSAAEDRLWTCHCKAPNCRGSLLTYVPPKKRRRTA